MTTNNDLAQAREWAEWIIQADSQVEVDPDLRGPLRSSPPSRTSGSTRTSCGKRWTGAIASLPATTTTESFTAASATSSPPLIMPRGWAVQTHEWEALLDGTTEGPWFANVRGFGRIENIGPISTGFSIGDGLDCDEDDAILAAHAPAAVAEVIRLRKAIEDAIRSLRAPLCSRMPEGDELDEYLEEWEMQGYAAHILTSILEGDANE